MRWLITGGAGFIGYNAALAIAKRGDTPFVIDDCSGSGSFSRLRSLMDQGIKCQRADICGREGKEWEFPACDVVLHLAAQTAATTSFADPCGDLAVNALGTLNVLQRARDRLPRPPLIIYASTNKVYGRKQPYRGARPDTPYGISKHAGELYCKMFGFYGIRSVILRQSCIYGPHQDGTFDQGWVGHMLSCLKTGRSFPITGTGNQVRDLLHVDDLVKLYMIIADTRANKPDHESANANRSETYDVGGGEKNATSVLDLARFMGVAHHHVAKRDRDQTKFVANLNDLRFVYRWFPTKNYREEIYKMTDSERKL